ncbi:CRE-CLC-1 protein [Aphelenchoides avenae]|nr:CRE-CLC-1 protein [Aphelenchus avenae]
MILAIIVEVAILIWSVLSCFAFCYPSLFYPLPMLSALATIFLLVAVAVFGGKNSAEVRSDSDLGYSFWIGVVALIVMFLATIVGFGVASITAGPDDDRVVVRERAVTTTTVA